MTGSFVARAAVTLVVTGWCACAQARDKVKVGVLTDMGGAMSDYAGPRSVKTAQLAIDDFRKAHGDIDVELVAADSQNKPDVASTIVRRWFDQEGVDVVVDVPNSAVVLALSELVRDRNKALLSTSASSVRITGDQCTPNTINWTYSTWALANGTGQAVVRNGGSTWFFVAVDVEYGKSISADMQKVVEAGGGKILGTVRHPLGTTDYSSYLLQAQASKARVIALANGGTDTINAIKQAGEFGIVTQGQTIVPTVLYLTDVHSLGLNVTQGLQFTTAFYWDLNEGTREFASRFEQVVPGRAKPTQVHAAVYSALTAYLRSVSDLKSAKDGKAIIANMRDRSWFEDPLFGRTRVRLDGTVEHAMYLAEVKKPSESRGPYDYYRILDTIPAEKAFQPMEETGCPLVKQ